MAVLRRRNKKQNLIDIPTLISEEGIDSKYFQIFGIPEELTTGKSSFIIGGSPFLKSGVKLKLEILDSQGEVIYTEPVFGYREGVNRRVSIEIYDSKPAGEAIITLLGEIDPVKSDVLIPAEWQGVYNVKYTRRISINPTLLNTQPIRFHKQPFVNISPLTNAFKEYIQQPEETRILTATLSSDINVAASAKTTDPVTQEESYPEEDQAEKAFDFMALYNQPAFRQSSFSNFRMPFRFQLFSPARGDSNLIVSSGSLDDGMIGKKIIINDPQVDTSSPDIPTTYTVPSQYSSSIIDITNDTTLNLAKAFYVTGEDGSTKYPVNLSADQAFTCSFSPIPTEQDSVINYFDLADITISKLRTFSGDIKYVRVFSISQGSQTEQQFDFLGEFPLESQELLFDYNNIKSGRTGFFFNQEKINSYWHAYGGNRATTASGSGEPADSIQLAQTGSIIRYAMDISGSNAGLNQEIMVQTSQSFSLSKSVPYELSFKVYGSRQSKTTSTGDKQKARIDFFMSGSNFNPNHEFGGTYGRRILTVDFDDSVEYPELQNLASYDWNKNYLSGMFIPLQGGTGKLQIRVSSGRWHIADVSLRPSADTNFSPETARIFAEMPPSRNRPDTVKFLLEFVNNDGVKADSVILSSDVVFPGANFAIQGDNNVLSGSMYISNAIGEGIEMAGLNSAFLRTIGWEGFNSASNAGKGGFIIYSGSVLPDSPDNYAGAGLEIHDGNSGSSERYFQFRTDDGTGDAIFRVKTDDYLFGISGSGGVESYISGADGTLEISSSNFSISNTGDVNMSGVVTATSGKIGDWTISNGDIVGANITMDADSSRIYKTDSNNELSGFYMDFTPGSNYYVRFGTDFAVSSSGQLIASGAIIEGVLTSSEGYIANWTIADNTINKLDGSTYTGLSSTGDARFFAGAANLGAGTSSAVFNVKDDGQISGSDVLFTGGTIGGFHISSTDFWGGNPTLGNSATKIVLGDIGDGETPKIALGTSANSISLASGTGLYVDGDGDFKVGSTSKYLKYTVSGDTMEVKTGTFELDANNLEISSTESSMSLGEGKIILDGGTISTITVGSDADRQINITGSSTLAAIRTGKKSATDTTTSGFWLANNATDPEFYIGNAADTAHIKFDGGDASLKTGTFELDATNIEISSTQKSMSLGDGAIKLVGASTSTLTVGSTAGKLINITGSSDRGIINTGKESLTDTTAGFWLANVNGTPQFNVGDSTSFIKYTGTDMTINSRAFELSASNLEISSTNASMSIGPATSPYILLDGTSGVSANESYIAVGNHATKRINISGSATKGVINTGKEDVDDTTTGFWLANNNGNVEVNIGDSDNFLKMRSGDFTLNVDLLDIDATDIEVSSTQKSASFGHDTDVGTLVIEGAPARLTIVSGSIGNTEFQGNTPAGGYHGEILKIGDITDNDGGDKFGLMMFDGTGNDVETDRILSLGDRGNVIAGWELTTDQIRAIPDAGVGENYAEGETKMIIHSAGRIETSDFATGLKGWRIDSAGNGTAEFENARIRGTLRTTVFEKESVNVVGGQLMVANSTVIEPLVDQSGSILAGAASMSATDTTMSCANVSGFSAGEIIKAKKVDDTGFIVEYMYVTGSMRYTEAGSPYSASIAAQATGGNMGANDPDGLAGELYVGRAYGSVVNVSSSIGTVDTTIPTTGTYETEANIILDLGSNYVVTQSILKINDERFKVISASNALGTTGNNQTIRVIRDYHDTDPAQHTAGTTVYNVDTDKEFLAGLISTAQPYNEGQVIVSTGKYDATKDLSSGYIIMNANPNDISTPYMDIVERTGSGVYDLQLRARLGDLSGLSSGYLYGEEEPGFGLYTDNGFFRGTIQAMTGSIHGILNVATTAGGIETGDKIMIGRNVDGSSDGIRIDGSNYWYTTGAWRVGGATNYLSLDNASGGNIDIAAETFRLRTSTFIISSSLNSGTLRLGPSGGPSSATDTSNTGSYFDGTGNFAFVAAPDEYLRLHARSGGDKVLEARLSELNLVAGNMTLSGSSTSYMKVGTLTGVTDTGATRKGFWVDNDGNMLLKGGTANTDYIKVASGGSVTIKSQLFDLETAGLDIIGTSGTAASNKIRLGNTAVNNDAFAGNSTGIYMDGGGNFRIGDATSANYFKVSAGGSVTIGTDTIEISATDFDLSSTNKKIDLGEGDIVLQGATNATSSVTVGTTSGKQMVIGGSATEAFIKSGKVNVEDSTNSGFWIANHDADPEFYLGDGGDNEFIKFDGGTLEIKAQNVDITSQTFKVESAAGLVISALDTSTAGNNYISLGTLGDVTTVNNSNRGFRVDGDGNILIKAGTTANKDYLKFTSSGLSIRSANLDLQAGGINIVGTSATSGSNFVKAGALSSATDAADSSTGVFIDGDGNFLAKSGGSGSGYIQAASGDIAMRAGNFDLQTTGLKLVGTTAAGANNYMALGSLTSDDPNTTNYGFYADGGGDVLIKGSAIANKEYIRFASNGLTINTATASISAGNLSIEANASSQYIEVGGLASATDVSSASTGVYIDSSGNFLAKSATEAGEGYIKAEGGDIELKTGTFNLNAGGGNLLLDSSVPKLSMNNAVGKILLGSATTVDLGEGFYADGGGNFRIGDATSGGTDYLKFTSGGNLDIKSQTFELDAGTLVVSSSNNGVIALGESGQVPIAYDSGTGFYVDGTGKILIGSGSGDRVQFDGDNLTIQSDNFTLNSAGDVTMRGTVTADAGDIGGFTIQDGKLSAVASGDSLLIQSAASGSQKIQLSDADGALAALRFENLTASSSLGGAQTFNTTGQSTPASAIALDPNQNVCSATSTDGYGYWTSTTATSLFEFGQNGAHHTGSNLPLIAVSSGDASTADSGYIFKMVIKGSVSASMWEANHNENFGGAHDTHMWAAGSNGTTRYTLNIFNKTTGDVIGTTSVSRFWTDQDIEATEGDRLGPWTTAAEAIWNCDEKSITLEGNFQTGTSAPTLQYQLTQSVTNFDFNVAWSAEEGGGSSGTENAYMSANTEIISFLCEPNSKVTEITPKGIQTVHTITEGSEKYFIVDHSKTGSVGDGSPNDDYWFISSAGNFRHYGNIYATDDIYAYYTSDLRLKKNIELIQDPIDKIKQIKGVSFSWDPELRPVPKEYHNPRELGVIAQDILPSLPEVVREKRDGYLAVKYEQLIPVLVEGIKEQQKQIDELNEKINSMVCGSAEPT